jgi:hypothetical protein
MILPYFKIILIFLFLISQMSAKIIHVDDDASLGGNGLSWDYAHKYLQDALAVAESGDEIWVAEGTYKPDRGQGRVTGDRSSTFVLVNEVGLYGGFLGTENSRVPQGDHNQTILSGEIDDNSSLWSLHVVSGGNLSGSTVLDGIRITKGNANLEGMHSSGGGLYLTNSKLVIRNCNFAFNRAKKHGGGIYNTNSSLSFLNCDFQNNFSGYAPWFNGGGGAGSEGGGGSAIFNLSSNNRMINCDFGINDGLWDGSIISDHKGALQLSGCSLYITKNLRGIYAVDSNNLILNDCSLYNEPNDKLWVRSWGMRLSDVNNTSIKGCTFHSNGQVGGGVVGVQSSLQNANNFYISETVFNNIHIKHNLGGDYLLSILGNIDSQLSKCIFMNNIFPFTGLALDSTKLTNCVFSNNTITRNRGYVVNTSGEEVFFMNCIFYNNSFSIGDVYEHGGLLRIASADHAVISNCVFVQNTSDLKISSLLFETSNVSINNSIFWNNSRGSNGLSIDGDWTSAIKEAGVEESFPGDPNSKKTIYYRNNIIETEWEQDTRAFSANPLFVNINDPDGDDNKWFTEDDGLQLKEESPGINSGHNNSIQKDFSDLDNDGNTEERIPFDISSFPRVQAGVVDIGAYEYGGSNDPTYLLSTTISPLSSGSVDGGNKYFDFNETVVISASPSKGYRFLNWGGSFNDTANPLTIKIDADKTITAYFIIDTFDNDGDGVNNYQELITFLTDPNKQDTDNDGILDSKEIEIGSDPKTSDAVIFNFGKTTVTNDPTSYSLVTKSAHDQALLDAKESAEQAIADAKVSARAEGVEEGKSTGLNEGKAIGRSEGEQSVTSNPSAYNLVTKSSYDQMMNDLMSASDSNATHYTEGWFYLPSRGWMWTDRSVYPYFYDSEDNDWMYFQSGNEKPRFYRYKTKAWLTVE